MAIELREVPDPVPVLPNKLLSILVIRPWLERAQHRVISILLEDQGQIHMFQTMEIAQGQVATMQAMDSWEAEEAFTSKVIGCEDIIIEDWKMDHGILVLQLLNWCWAGKWTGGDLCAMKDIMNQGDAHNSMHSSNIGLRVDLWMLVWRIGQLKILFGNSSTVTNGSLSPEKQSHL